MAKRIQVSFEGQLVPADQLDFEGHKEPWSIYRLEDGTELRIRTLLASVARLVDRYRPDGEPIYVIGVGGIPVLDVPFELRKSNVEKESAKE